MIKCFSLKINIKSAANSVNRMDWHVVLLNEDVNAKKLLNVSILNVLETGEQIVIFSISYNIFNTLYIY